MKKKLFLTILLSSVFLSGCLDNEIAPFTPCPIQDLQVTPEHNTIYDHPNPLYGEWIGQFSDDYVVMRHAIETGIHMDIFTFKFKFKKIYGCLELIDSYRVFTSDYSMGSLIHLEVLDIQIQEWILDTHLSGEVTYLFQGDEVTHKFWIDFTPEDIYEEPIFVQSFQSCMDTEFLINIDLNNDSVDDFSIDYSVQEFDLTIPIERYTLTFQSLDDNHNTLVKT